ncbi:GxxExxY protein [Carboxylicivirga sp. M1479]|uniref:GxxExxY protein n=1 Tax=Carboxylicivirga sp. M1479 TaxID=2594476 RepID=UPI0011783CF2|nr:GxxExxY protein [Carboxylicivirga sp. M1479]TRX71989.1 GxxExxY protein [Carboxylicivirga sp. M1479]
MTILPDKEKTYKIIGCCMEVHSELGGGMLEPIYQEALAIELANKQVSFKREEALRVYYKGVELNKRYKADFVCYDEIIIELKAVSELTDEHMAQVINYLKITGKKLALLVNFGNESLEYKRVINS